MPDKFKRFVLGEDEDPPDVGVDAIRKREIDDAVHSAETHSRFGGVTRQGVKSLARATR
jgi:hypothetical protein